MTAEAVVHSSGQTGGVGDRIAFDPTAAGYFDDPYPHYAELRAAAPVHRAPMGVMCFRHDDVWGLLRHQGMAMGTANLPPRKGRKRPRPDLFPSGLINLDPPDHPRVRRLMSRVFTPRRIEGMSAWIAEEVDRILDDVEVQLRDASGPVDLVSQLAFPLPFKVISDILGMPEADDDQVREWAQSVSEGTLATSRAELERATAAYHAISAYVNDEVLPWKRQHPAEDLLSVLLAAQDEGEMLSREEVIDQVTLLYVAGHETTSGLIGNGILNLLRNPGQLHRLRVDPSLLPNAVEELNRYDSAIQFTWRYALADMRIGDVDVEAGDIVWLGLGSANRDETCFGSDAGDLDIGRKGARDALSFGAGPHYCIGAALARREGALAIGALVERFDGLELAAPPVWNPRITFRAVAELSVGLGG